MTSTKQIEANRLMAAKRSLRAYEKLMAARYRARKAGDQAEYERLEREIAKRFPRYVQLGRRAE